MAMTKTYSRRALLGGAAVTVGLPFLSSLPGLARAQGAADKPRRLLVYIVSNGVHMRSWMPDVEGENYKSETLANLDPIRKDALVLTGINNSAGVSPTRGGHAGGGGGLTTCVQIKRSGVRLGKSFDQVAADAVGTRTRLRSLQLGFDDGGSCEGWPCAYHRNISWTGPTTPAPKITSPRQAFDRLFAGFEPRATGEDVARRRALRKSVLDAVLTDAQSLDRKLAASDQARLDEYLTFVRELESRIDRSEGATCKVPGAPSDGGSFPERVAQMQEIMALAFQCDATRVISFQIGNFLGGQNYAFIGAGGNHHSLTHHAGSASRIAAVKKVDAWRLQQLTKLVQRLKSMQDPDGTSVLANTLVYYSSEIADSDRHDQNGKPIVLAGQLGGKFKTGQHVKCGPYYPLGTCHDGKSCEGKGPELGNLYITILRAMGISIDTFGETGKGFLPTDVHAKIANFG